jgi:hypothetical protein
MFIQNKKEQNISNMKLFKVEFMVDSANGNGYAVFPIC